MNTFKRMISVLLLAGLLFQTSFAAKLESNIFQFQIGSYETKRQGGQTLNVYVRYKTKPNADFPDYRELRKHVLLYLEPSDELPVNTFWEYIAQNIGKDLMKGFPLDGVSVQLQVFPHEDGDISEPGFHGPTYTLGKIKPLDVSPPVKNNN